MVVGDANSGLSWTVIYEVAKAIFSKILSLRFHSRCPLLNIFFSVRIKHGFVVFYVHVLGIACNQSRTISTPSPLRIILFPSPKRVKLIVRTLLCVYVCVCMYVCMYVKKVRTGPRAYVPDALQPVGLLCYPCTILVF
jgi:hypothetical protein